MVPVLASRSRHVIVYDRKKEYQLFVQPIRTIFVKSGDDWEERERPWYLLPVTITTSPVQ